MLQSAANSNEVVVKAGSCTGRGVYLCILPAYLLQDHEKALRCECPREAMRQIGLQLLEEFPVSSQDLNAIETAWREVQARLRETEPVRMEDRPTFLQRLRTAVAWVNRNRADYLWHLCTNQKIRPRDVQALNGGRTRH